MKRNSRASDLFLGLKRPAAANYGLVYHAVRLWRRRADSNRRIEVLQTSALDHLATSPCLTVTGAEEETRTPTALRPQRPQRCVSTNSTTSACPIITWGTPRSASGGWTSVTGHIIANPPVSVHGFPPTHRRSNYQLFRCGDSPHGCRFFYNFFLRWPAFPGFLSPSIPPVSAFPCCRHGPFQTCCRRGLCT